MTKKACLVVQEEPTSFTVTSKRRGVEAVYTREESQKRPAATVQSPWQTETPVEKLNKLLNAKYQLADAAKPNEDYPQFPTDIHDTHIAEIGRLHGLYTAWANYIDERLAVLSGDKLVDDDQREMSETVARLKDEGTYHKKRDSAKVSKETRERSEKAIQTTVMTELLKAKLRSCERAIKSLSRELSRRGLQVQIDG